MATPFDEPVPWTVLIQNGCPGVFTLKIKVSPRFRLMEGSEPAKSPLKVKSILLEVVTSMV